MKKRKPPYVLAGLLIAALSAAVIISASAKSDVSGLQEEPIEQLQATDEPEPKPVAKNTLLERIKMKAPVDDSPIKPLDKRKKIEDGAPIVKRPTYTPVKPKPKPGEVDSQWYRD